MAALLSLIMVVGVVPLNGFAFAWGTEGQVCSSKFGDRYVGFDGENYYAASTVEFIVYDDDGNISRHSKTSGNVRRKYLMVEADGSERYVYCIESGVDFGSSTNEYTSTSGRNSRYFQNLPKAAREGIMLATVYGWREGKSTPVAGTNNDDYALATQIIIWEYQQQLRTSPTRIEANSLGIPADSYYQTIQGRPAEKCYDWILQQMASHLVVPSFSGKTHTLEYNASTKQYSITLTDTNNTYADLKLTNANGITVTRSGNRYTFTSSRMITETVTVSVQKNVSDVDGSILIWGRPGKQTMLCGSDDPIFFTLNFKTETYGTARIIKSSEDGKVAGIKFRITGNGVNEVVTTTSNGTVSKSLLPGTYTVTELAEDRYIENASKTVTVSSNQTAEVSFFNKLKKGDLRIEKTCDDGLAAGLEFRVTAPVIGYDETFETKADGTILIEDLQVYDSQNRLITYQVEEVDTPIRYEAVAGQSSKLIYGGEVTLKFHNKIKTEHARILKVAEDGDIVGIKFRVTSDNGYDQVFTTDANGSFIIEELPVYNTSDEIIRYTVSEIETDATCVQPESQTFTLIKGNVTLEFANILKKFRVEVTKRDAVTGSRPQGDGSLAGAKYGIYKNGELVDVFTTDSNGYFITPYYACDDNWELKEISPSEGYLLDTASYHIGAEAKLYTVEYNTIATDVNEHSIMGSIAIIKHADTGETQIETPEEGATFEIFLSSAGSYENARENERDILVCDADGVARSKELPYGRYTVRQTSGWEDTEYMPAFTVYINTHGEVYKYLINNAPFTSYLKLVKIDSETGRQIPYAGAAFQIYDANGQRVVMQYTYPALTEADTFYTSADGYLITPEKLNQGCYQLVEVQAPYGYVLHDEPVRFKVDDDEAVYEDGLTLIVVDFPNEPQKGAIHIKKTGEVFSSVQTNGEAYLPVYSVQGLAGATFKIIADEDIITPDGTVRAKKGDVVDTITTSATGEAQSKALYLGRYRVVEVQCPYGMLLSGEQTVELVYAGQYVELADVSASFYNERQKVQIKLEKVIETDETFDVGGDRTVTFGLFAAEEIKASDGSVIPVDGLIEIIQFSTSGAGTFTADIPFGAFYVKELQSAGPEYLSNNTKYPVVFEYQEQDSTDIATVEIKVNDGNPILNELIYGSVKGLKVDESNAPVAGAVIGLFRPDETEFTRENAFMVDISSASGEFSFENVVYGHWVIAEIEQPEGFILTLEVYHVYIDSDGMAIDIVMENERIKGNVLLAKLDEDYPENKLTGAVFDVYEDANGNGKFDEEDVFVNALEETETGIYELNDLICGNYLIVESAAPEGFEKDENVYFFEIRTNGETVIVENEAGVGFLNKAQLGNLVISKSSEDGILEGFEFVVEGVDFLGNKYSETFETDAEGKISVSIRPGAYEVFEKDAPDNVRYVMPDGQTVEITANEESALVFANVLKKGSIEFRKVDKSTGKPLAGVSFAIYKADENMIAEGKTDSNGILRFDGIIYGNYLWQETATVDGYIAQPGFHKFSVTEHGQLITVTAENEPIPDVPKTGDNSSLPVWFGLLALSGGSLAGLLFFDRKIKTSLKG